MERLDFLPVSKADLEERDWWYYDFLVTAGGKTRSTADPYARACGVNGERSMVVDLADINVKLSSENTNRLKEVSRGDKLDYDKVRDVLEAAILEAFEKQGKPIFGICRGIQAMNVFGGGTLYQDIETQMEGTPQKHWIPQQKDRETQPVIVQNSTKLGEILGETEIKVNSMHHQAVKTVAKGFVVSARCTDGTVEAIEKPGASFVLGVQWHPEHLKDSALQQRLFEAFVDACL